MIELTSEPPRTADLVIVGGGVVGAASAFHAARAGLQPVILEARPALATLTTSVAAGAFRLQFDDLEELELARESVELFLNFEEVTRQRRYGLDVRPQGYLWLATEEATAGRQRELVTRLHDWGQGDVEILDQEEARRRFPFVGPNVIQARFRQADGFLDPKALTYGLAAASGTQIVAGCRVTGLAVRGDQLTGVRTTKGTVQTGIAVIAAGPLSVPLAEKAGLHLPLSAVRRHKLWMPGLEVVPRDAPMTIDEETGAHWRPAYGGAWVLYPDPAARPEPATEAVSVDPSFAFQVLDPSSPVAVARVVPFWRDVWARGAHPWVLQAGQYTMTPDRRPLIGPTGIEGLQVNTGYSGHGIMLSPAGSRMLVDLITGALEPRLNPFAPDRPFDRREPSLL